MRDNHDLNTHNDKKVPPGMLSSPHIRYYIEKYELFDGYEESCLEPASYNMRIGGPVLTWYGDTTIEFTLGDDEDENRHMHKSVTFRPNSLTFVTTIERFQLPKDIIARFNLKSKWVHQGLLLGTGPIVDPQLHAHLLIPVHNFSSQALTLKFKEEFISVEFTKTLNPDGDVPLDNKNENRYVNNEHWLGDFYKYRERITNKVIESSVQSQFIESNKQIELSRNTIEHATKRTEDIIRSVQKDAKETNEALKKESQETLDQFRRWGLLGMLGVILAFLTLFATTCALIYTNYEKADTAYNITKQYIGDSLDFKKLKSDYEKIQKEVMALKDTMSEDNAKKFIQLRTAYDVKLNDIESQIIMLQKEIRSSKGNTK